MSRASRIGDARMTVLLDLRHPLACLALRPTLAFAREHGLAPNWLPLEVPNLKPPSAEGEGSDRGTRHRRHRARALAREIETYAAAQGLLLREPYRCGDAGPAHRAWLWVRDRAPERLPGFLEALFDAYWSLALDAADPAALVQEVDRVGADGAGFASWCEGEGKQAAAVLAAELRERGLFAVPGYVVDGEFFQGRQHLPMLDWILRGRRGPGPI